jgi:chromosome segregation ATPase
MSENESCCSSNVPADRHAYEHSMENKMKELGAKIDSLKDKAGEKYEYLQAKREEAQAKYQQIKANSGEAYAEFKAGMDKAFDELHQAWEEAKKGTEKATAKLNS